MAARFGAPPRSSADKRHGGALRSAAGELNCEAAWLHASVRFRRAQQSSGMAALRSASEELSNQAAGLRASVRF
eukprot:3927246-Heterocapsa_arctica.AAC.2